MFKLFFALSSVLPAPRKQNETTWLPFSGSLFQAASSLWKGMTASAEYLSITMSCHCHWVLLQLFHEEKQSFSQVQTILIYRFCSCNIEGCFDCAVCQDKFTLGEEVRQLPCRHYFHFDCIEPWLKMVSRNRVLISWWTMPVFLMP